MSERGVRETTEQRAKEALKGKWDPDLAHMARAIVDHFAVAAGRPIYAWSDGSVTPDAFPADPSAYLITVFTGDSEGRTPAEIHDELDDAFSKASDEPVRNMGGMQEQSRDAPPRPKDVPGDQELEAAPPTGPGRITTARRRMDLAEPKPGEDTELDRPPEEYRD